MRGRGLEHHGGSYQYVGFGTAAAIALVPGISRLHYETTTTLGPTITHQQSLDIPIVPTIYPPGSGVTFASSRTLLWLHLVLTKRSAVFLQSHPREHKHYSYRNVLHKAHTASF